MAIDVIMIAGFSQSFCLAVEELRARLKPPEDSTHFLTLPDSSDSSDNGDVSFVRAKP